MKDRPRSRALTARRFKLNSLSEQDVRDRIALQNLFQKRVSNPTTKEAFLIYEDQTLAVAEGDQETYIIFSQDRAVGFPLFLKGECDLEKLFRAVRLLRNSGVTPDTLYDIGANIGSICLPALSRGLFQKAVAFEPDPKLHRLLRANAILNSVDSQLDVHGFGLGASYTSADLMTSNFNTGDNRIVGKSFPDDRMGEAEREITRIEVRPLDEFAEMIEPERSLLWMDVQGYEGFVLEGASKVLSKRPPLVAEFWPYGMKRLDSFERFRQGIAKAGYTHYAGLQEHEPQLRKLEPDTLERYFAALGDANPEAFEDFVFLFSQ